MTEYPDLSDYCYVKDFAVGHPKAVGWLGKQRGFAKGTVSEQALRRIEALTMEPVAPTRGGHFCEFCSQPAPLFYKIKGEHILLGTAEIRVFGADGQIYAAPDMLVHYIADHGYLPPREFLDAVMACPDPASETYCRLIEDLGLEFGVRSRFSP